MESAWAQAISQPGDVAAYCRTVEALCEQEMAGKALTLAGEMVEALAAAGRVDDARALAVAVVGNKAHNDKLAQRLYELILKQDSGQAWFERIRDMARLTENNVNAQSLIDYENYRQFTEGHVLFHRGGWGEGLVKEFRPETDEVVIDFVKGRAREMPLQAAIESLSPLAPDDLRAMQILQMDQLQHMMEHDPTRLIQLAARLFRGKITSTKLKEVLCPSVVPTKKWAGYWKRAKAAAAHDPWLQVEGTATRPVYTLRKKPISLSDEASREMKYAANLAESIEICRSYLGRTHDAAARDTILGMAQTVIEASLSRSGTETGAPDAAELLEGILLLGSHGRTTSVTPAEELRVLLTENGELHPERLNRLTIPESREHAVTLLPEALGEGWAETCAQALPLFPADVVEGVVQRIVDAGKAHLMVGLWDTVAPYPRRHPMMTYLMGCLYADGHFDGLEGAPDRWAVGRVLLHLVRTLTMDRKGDAMKGRLLTRLVSLMTGRREFLARILQDISKEDCANYFGITERGGPDFPQEIGNTILRTVANRFPELTAKPDKPFWELEFNYVTAEGLARRREEYRVLVEEKIPANSKAIGLAASHGDISENSEWDAAMEEQRNLTSRATTMDEELALARLIEDQHVPDETVAPGTRVTFTNLTENREQTVRLLGPWDVTTDDVLNYKAPLGQAMLGMKPGQVARLEIGGKFHELRIDNVEKVI
ncbi:MAG: GreA/GreB family elongation factor [Planctomycetes bacterium]|nr:GreA/GreB family elongation factor [Planctomycetota bacterium]